MFVATAHAVRRRKLAVVAGAVLLACCFAGSATAASSEPGGGSKGGRDTRPPSVSISTPASAATLGGNVTASGTAGDNAGLAKVELRVDSGPYQLTSGTTAWSASFDTTQHVGGTHVIAARATDKAGNSAVASVTVTFANAPPPVSPSDTTPPTVTISLPSAGASLTGLVSISGTATDDRSVARVAVSFDGGAYELAAGTSNWSYEFQSTGYPDGPHTITARATDAAGNHAATSRAFSVINNVFVGPTIEAPPMAPGTLGGYAFQDVNRDGVFQVGELPLASQHLCLYSGSGAYLGTTYSGADGWYTFAGLADGAYLVRYAADSWFAIRDDWVPDTSGSVLPHFGVTLAGTGRADLGWRRIVRSTDPNRPLSSYVAPNGLRVQSYDDVVSAQAIFERLTSGTLIGAEAPMVTVRFDFNSAAVTTTSALYSGGSYTWYSATSYVDYASWLDASDRTLFHEYGHAWSLYNAYMMQQDPTLTRYLRARGLLGDPRVGTSYAWDPKELVAEDYRQLFGSPNAQLGGQINRDLPLAKNVPGLKSFLETSFTQPPPGG